MGPTVPSGDSQEDVDLGHIKQEPSGFTVCLELPVSFPIIFPSWTPLNFS